MEKYPKEYKSLEYVINKEFILPLDYYTKHPSLARFREAYSLIRDREAKSVFDALKYALNVMFKYDLNPAIISACKTEEALNFYIECLENKDLSRDPTRYEQLSLFLLGCLSNLSRPNENLELFIDER